METNIDAIRTQARPDQGSPHGEVGRRAVGRAADGSGRVTAPLYLTGLLAPVATEVEARDLPVTGAVLPELNGRYFRNGPNPCPGQDPGSWFTGQGMLHGIRLQSGRARWYRNRWVRTAALAGPPARRSAGPGGAHRQHQRHPARRAHLRPGRKRPALPGLR